MTEKMCKICGVRPRQYKTSSYCPQCQNEENKKNLRKRTIKKAIDLAVTKERFRYYEEDVLIGLEAMAEEYELEGRLWEGFRKDVLRMVDLCGSLLGER